jgi:GxxExxY protein
MRMKSNEVREPSLAARSRFTEPWAQACSSLPTKPVSSTNCSNVGLRCERQKPLPVVYHGVRLDCGERIDLLVEDVVLVELKAVSRVLAIHHAQRMTYLKLSDLHVGLLLNFHVLRMRDGIHRYVRELPE